MIVAAPTQVGHSDTQYVQSLNTQGWSKYDGAPDYTGAAFQGQFYIAALNGKVYRHAGDLDNRQSGRVLVGADSSGVS